MLLLLVTLVSPLLWQVRHGGQVSGAGVRLVSIRHKHAFCDGLLSRHVKTCFKSHGGGLLGSHGCFSALRVLLFST